MVSKHIERCPTKLVVIGKPQIKTVQNSHQNTILIDVIGFRDNPKYMVLILYECIHVNEPVFAYMLHACGG